MTVSDSKMRAVVVSRFGGPEVLERVELPVPVPLPTELLVRVHAAGVNPIDWKTRNGAGVAAVVGAPPFVPGWDVSGVVEEIGFGATAFAPGDEVFGMPWFPRAAGGYAEFVTAPSRQFVRKPANLTHEQAAAVPLAALTAWQALVTTAQVGAGDRVLIHGAAGGVGHFAVQIAKIMGAHVTATARSVHRPWLRQLGVDECIDYTQERFDDRGADQDIILDLVGDVHATTDRSIRLIRPGGMILLFASDPSPVAVAEADRGGVRVVPFIVEPDGAALGAIAEHLRTGTMTVNVTRTYPLEEAARAHREREARHPGGKAVLAIKCPPCEA